MITTPRVLLLEFNEISWELMKPELAAGKLPNFHRLREEGSWTHTVCDETGELLDPWVTWTTLLTGVPQSEHGIAYLEQPPETLKVPRLWDVVHEAGKRAGVFGSASSWPPRDIGAFMVPGAFSPDTATWPAKLQPIQDLNVTWTRAHSPTARKPGAGKAAALGLRLMALGLDTQTALEVAGAMAEIKLHPERDWKKVCLQPLLNFAFFRKLWRETRPDFATFHTNHVAHYQHRFMRARYPEKYPDPTEPKELERFGEAISHGYRTADALLGKFFALADDDPDVVLCVTSSMGQKPWLPDRHGGVAPESCRLRSIDRLVEILGIRGRCEAFSTMAPQWNLKIPELGILVRAARDLEMARYEPLGQSMYSVRLAGDTIVLTPIKRHGLDSETRCVFPTVPGSPEFPFAELVVREDATRKSGCHDPVGMLAFHGAGVRKGFHLDGQVHIMDIAPTILSRLEIEIPARMRGAVLDEMFEAQPRRSGTGQTTRSSPTIVSA